MAIIDIRVVVGGVITESEQDTYTGGIYASNGNARKMKLQIKSDDILLWHDVDVILVPGEVSHEL